MLVFITGAAGFIGRAVISELLSHGHSVLGLARSSTSASIITEAGGTPHHGDLEDLESLKSGAAAADGVIHLAFIPDFSDFPRVSAIDRAAISAMGEVMAGTGKPLVIASGTLAVPRGFLATEDTEHPFAARALSADLVYALSKEKNIRGSVIRLSVTVHDKEDKGMVPRLIAIAKDKGVITIVGKGEARWPAVHRRDAAVLFRLALEKGLAGATYNAVAEQGVAMKDIMAVVSKHLKLPVEEKALQDAMGDLGFIAHLVVSDNPTSSEKTRKELGWEPAELGLLADVDANYF